MDLIARVRAGERPVDEPLPWLFADGRAARQVQRWDRLWLRVLDVPAALTGRGYLSPGGPCSRWSTPAGYAAGRFELDAGPDGARCRPTTRSGRPHRAGDGAGRAYLGGTRLRRLAGAGLVDEHRPGAVEAAEAGCWPATRSRSARCRSLSRPAAQSPGPPAAQSPARPPATRPLEPARPRGPAPAGRGLRTGSDPVPFDLPFDSYRTSRREAVVHVPDGFFDAPVSVAAGWRPPPPGSGCLRGARRELDERIAPLAGLVAAFVFAVQMLNFPVAAGTSGHLLGGALAAVLVGPWTGVLCVAVVLLVQGSSSPTAA